MVDIILFFGKNTYNRAILGIFRGGQEYTAFFKISGTLIVNIEALVGEVLAYLPLDD